MTYVKQIYTAVVTMYLLKVFLADIHLHVLNPLVRYVNSSDSVANDYVHYPLILILKQTTKKNLHLLYHLDPSHSILSHWHHFTKQQLVTAVRVVHSH
jgi:hypothetical protein